jgi:2-C-methyl-D-erythritol 4-phosphate cytidylyltransferase
MTKINDTKARIFAIVPAAGTGTRMGDALPKQYLPLNGKPMIMHTLSAIARVARIDTIVVVISADDPYWDATLELADESLQSRVQVFRVGGKTRAESVLNGLDAVASVYTANDWALVHDAARPCVRTELIEQFLDELVDEPIGGLLALPVADTLKRSGADQRVEATVARQDLWRAQTPQMFRYQLLRDAILACPNATDEAQAVELKGLAPRLVIGESANLKVTYATDLQIAKILLSENRS